MYNPISLLEGHPQRDPLLIIPSYTLSKMNKLMKLPYLLTVSLKPMWSVYYTITMHIVYCNGNSIRMCIPPLAR